MSGKRWQNGKSQHETNRFCWREKKIITRRENKEINQREEKTTRKEKTQQKEKSRTNEKNEKMTENKGTEQKMEDTHNFFKKKKSYSSKIKRCEKKRRYRD